jgi:hypothetical protein
MRKNRKRKFVNNTYLPIQLLKQIPPYVKYFKFKADEINPYEAFGVKLECKLQLHNSQANETKQDKEETTIWVKLWLFVAEQSLTAFFQFMIMNLPRFIP